LLFGAVLFFARGKVIGLGGAMPLFRMLISNPRSSRGGFSLAVFLKKKSLYKAKAALSKTGRFLFGLKFAFWGWFCYDKILY